MGQTIPDNCISVEEARELQDTWNKTRGKELKTRLGFEDTREFWWSVEELEEYLNYVKKESLKQGIQNPGIRVYFGAYSKEKCQEKKGFSTLFLSPTESPSGSFTTASSSSSLKNNYKLKAFNRGGTGNPPHRY